METWLLLDRIHILIFRRLLITTSLARTLTICIYISSLPLYIYELRLSYLEHLGRSLWFMRTVWHDGMRWIWTFFIGQNENGTKGRKIRWFRDGYRDRKIERVKYTATTHTQTHIFPQIRAEREGRDQEADFIPISRPPFPCGPVYLWTYNHHTTLLLNLALFFPLQPRIDFLRVATIVSYNTSLNANKNAAVNTLWLTFGPIPIFRKLAKTCTSKSARVIFRMKKDAGKDVNDDGDDEPLYNPLHPSFDTISLRIWFMLCFSPFFSLLATCIRDLSVI